MKAKIKPILPKVTVVIPMRNAESTILKTLEGIKDQTYHIEEVIVVDNVSTDQSREVVREYMKKNRKMNLRLILNTKDIMVAGSFNRGIKASKTDYVVTMHGDCCFASKKELSVLMGPILNDSSIIAAYGIIENPLWIWKEYSFWEKCLMAKHAGKPTPGLVGKIDCYQKKALLSIRGYDSVRYAKFGGEDADLHLRLLKVGKIVQTNAKVIHLHFLAKNFSILDWFRKKRNVARTYGRLLRVHGYRLGLKGITAFLVVPFLAVGSLMPIVNYITIPLIIIFPFWYYKIMFVTKETLTDPRIFLVPLLGIFMVYYEAFWTLESFARDVEK